MTAPLRLVFGMAIVWALLNLYAALIDHAVIALAQSAGVALAGVAAAALGSEGAKAIMGGKKDPEK